MITDSEIYAKAADLLGEGGHCKGNLRTDEGQRCALGALKDAEAQLMGYEEDTAYPPRYNPYPPRYNALGNRAARRLMSRAGEDDTFGFEVEDPNRNPHFLAPIAYWNDLPETTGEDVILLFKEMAHE